MAMDEFDGWIVALTENLCDLREEVGWREALRRLKAAAPVAHKPKRGSMEHAALVLVMDYYHLVEDGLRPELALDVVLSPAMGVEQ